MNSTKIKLAVLVILVAAVLACRFWLPTSAAIFLITRWGYWLMLAGVGVYVYQLACFIKTKRAGIFLRTHWKGLLISMLGVLFIEAHEPRQFKVLFDEFVISGVARDCHFLREPTYPIKAHYVSDQLEVFDSTIDKRPFFFPFVLSCVHDLTGYRPENVFVLNAIAAFLLLFLTYYFGVQYGGWRLGLACVALWLGLPLLAQSATSGGYDVFNLLMLMLSWYFGREYLRSGSALTQSLFVLTTVYLAQVRYESMLMVLAMATIILLHWYRQKACQLGWVVVFSPLHLLLPVLINLIFMRTPGFTQTDEGQAYFSVGYLQENLERAVWYLFNLNFRATNSAILAIIGVVSIIAFFVKMAAGWRRWVARGDEVMFISLGVVVLINTGLVLCNFWGQFDDSAASRFSLPLHLLFICCFAWVIHEWRGLKPMPVWLAAVVVLATILAVPAAARNAATRSLMSGREFSWFFEVLKAPDHRGALVISQPVGPILYNHPAVSMETAEENKWKINECLKLRLYPEILVLERWAVDFRTGEEKPYSDDKSLDMKKGKFIGAAHSTLSSSFRMEKVAEMRVRPNVVARISRIVGVEGPEAVPPESYLKAKFPFETLEAYYFHIYSALP